MNGWVLLIGNPATGYQVFGPFATKRDADAEVCNWADIGMDSITVMEIKSWESSE